ncbi:hypothetical protein QQ045_012891 [Rhodiola kirilowii]
MTWILNLVSKNVVGQILHSENVVIAWRSSNMKYGGSNASRKFSLQQEIANLMQGDMDVSTYHEKLVNLWHELDSMKKYKLCVVSDDCSKCLETKRTHKLALREFPSIDAAYDMVATKESERNIAKVACIEASTMASAMYVPYQGSNNVHKQQFQS